MIIVMEVKRCKQCDSRKGYYRIKTGAWVCTNCGNIEEAVTIDG